MLPRPRKREYPADTAAAIKTHFEKKHGAGLPSITTRGPLPIDGAERMPIPLAHGKRPHPDPRALDRHAADSPRVFVQTGIHGLDQMFEKGIPHGSTVLLAGGAGSGKTLLGLQILAHQARLGRRALFMSFEESETRLREHMEDFGWHPRDLERHGMLRLMRLSTFDIGRSLDALMAQARGELLIDVKPVILPEDFKPDFIVVDSLTAIASSLPEMSAYRSYIEHLFRYFEELGVTAFLVTETEQVPTLFSPRGVEEFLADGVVVFYNVRKGDIRENGIEVLKMRGAKHLKKVVAMRIVPGSGIEVYPDQEIFGGIN